ncbi:MAG: hypothetical protein OEN23_00395 [Paracoccaceae bacterium]|nr:hypothetical protein [Paracoccaceae bacterium]
MDLSEGLLSNDFFLRLVQLLAILSVVGALIATGFVLFQMKFEPGSAGDDPNWRSLFLLWWDSAAIMVLYAGVSFVWLFERFIGILASAMYADQTAGIFNLQYVLLVLEFVIYGMILIVAIRLSLRIRRRLRQG